MSIDIYQGFRNTPAGPYSWAEIVTPSDEEDLENITSAIYASQTGDDEAAITFISQFSDDPVTIRVPSTGILLPVRVKRVLATGTTADVVAFY